MPYLLLIVPEEWFMYSPFMYGFIKFNSNVWTEENQNVPHQRVLIQNEQSCLNESKSCEFRCLDVWMIFKFDSYSLKSFQEHNKLSWRRALLGVTSKVSISFHCHAFQVKGWNRSDSGMSEMSPLLRLFDLHLCLRSIDIIEAK